MFIIISLVGAYRSLFYLHALIWRPFTETFYHGVILKYTLFLLLHIGFRELLSLWLPGVL